MNEQPENPATMKARCVNCGDVQFASEMYCSKSIFSSMRNGDYACVDALACAERQKALPFPNPRPPKNRFDDPKQRRDWIERYLRLHDPVVHQGLMMRDVGQCDYQSALELIVCYLAKENAWYREALFLWYQRFPPSVPVADLVEIQRRMNEQKEIIAKHMEQSSTVPGRDRK